VTCNTCHNGSEHPAAMPAIAEAGETPMQAAHGEERGGRMNLALLPQPPAIVAKYVEALGGADALGKVKSRVIKGTMTAFGHALPVEIYAKAPDEWSSVMKSPRGQSMTVFNGHEGWASIMPRPPHPLEGGELDRASLEADFYFPLDLQKVFTSLRERPPEKVGDEEAYVVLGIRPGKPPVQLFFSEQSGLLLRMVYFTQTPLGRLPQQTDYSDYREVDGVKMPFQWTVAGPGGRSTVQVAYVQQNIPISGSKFAIPAMQGPAGQ
jgi:photosynthetic reaction center cytochrome c subunit